MSRSIRQGVLRGSVLLSSVSALWLGCGLPAEEEVAAPAPNEPPVVEHYGKNAAALTRALSCDDVLARIHQSTIERLLDRAEELRQPPPYYNGEPGIVVVDSLGPATPTAPPTSAPPPETSADNPQSPGGEQAGSGNVGVSPEFSGTTVQVEDVDEADIVKTDGDHLYLLQGGSLVKVRAWPAEETQTLSATLIEGEPIELFVHEGKAVVYSRVYRDVAQTDGSNPGYYPYYYYSANYTKLTVLDVDLETPEVLRESYLEGYYVSSRRHEDVVRTVMQDGYKVPSLDGVYIEYFTPFGEPYRQSDIDAQVDAWLDRTTWAVSQTELGDWLPRQFSVIDGEAVEQAPNCRDFYQPDLDLSQSGVTQVLSLDLDGDDGEAALRGAIVLARADRVYANDDVVLLSQTTYGSVENDYAEQTTLHRFDIDGAQTVYRASGTLPGYVHNQFSLDERAGVIRASTTENRWSFADDGNATGGAKNRVFTLSTSGGWLDIWGQTEVFGENEQIFATRFIGDLGYVVTFRRTDPLFVVDLSSPASPEVKGELVIPGFSNFLYPLGQDHLLSIGQDATLEGFAQGVSLQIFNVADPWYPTLAHKYVYPNDSYSDANADHRAISFHPELDRVAFPLTDWRQGVSTLEVFDLSVASGFNRRGAITPASPELTLEECVILLGYGSDALDTWLRAELEAFPGYAESLLAQCRSREQMRRGVFRGELVYGITNQAVYAHTVGGLAGAPVGHASLPPVSYDYYYYGGGAMSGVGGSAMGSGGGSFEDGTAGTGTGGAAGAGGSAMAGGSGGAPSDSP